MQDFNYDEKILKTDELQQKYEEKIFCSFFNDTKIANTEDIMKQEIPEDTMLCRAFNTALQTRKFEIELFWKRALFFWGFITVAFVAYSKVFEIIFEKNCSKSLFSDTQLFLLKITLIVISFCIYCFCIAFHFANRGSKYWQQNWENHIQRLEPRVQGKLFGARIKENDGNCFSKIFKLRKLYDISLSKLAMFISLILVVGSFSLTIGTAFFTFGFDYKDKVFLSYLLCLLVPIVLNIGLIHFFGTITKGNTGDK